MSTNSERCFEFVAMRGVSRELLGHDWPIAAGAVGRTATQRACLLHVAPGRWLAPDPDPELAARLDLHVKSGVGLLIDVAGKWHRIALPELGAARLLATGVFVDIVLAERACASLWLFDCPVVLARTGAQFELWVQSSYAPSFTATLESILNRSEA